MVRDGGQRREDREGVGPADDVLIEDPARALAQHEALGEEEEVELAALGGTGGVLEGRELDLAARPGIPPCGVVIDTAEVGPEDDLLACTHRSCPSVPAVVTA